MIFYYLKRSKSDNILKYCNQTVKHWLGAIEWALWRALLCTIITRAQAWAVLTSPTLIKKCQMNPNDSASSASSASPNKEKRCNTERSHMLTCAHTFNLPGGLQKGAKTTASVPGDTWISNMPWLQHASTGASAGVTWALLTERRVLSKMHQNAPTGHMHKIVQDTAVWLSRIFTEKPSCC